MLPLPIKPTDRSQRLRMQDIKKTIWLTRPDIRQLVSGDWNEFEWWLLVEGDKEYAALREGVVELPTTFLTAPASEALPEVKPTLTLLMKAVWSMRRDLQESYDLTKETGQNDYVWWYFLYGLKDLGLTRFLTNDQIASVNISVTHYPDTGFLPISRLMFELWARRPDLQQAFDLEEVQGRDAFLEWYFSRGLVEHGLSEMVSDQQAEALLAPSPDAPSVARILSILWHHDASLQSRFSRPDHIEFRRWAVGSARHDDYAILEKLKEYRGHNRVATTVENSSQKDLPFGVNLIGYARGQFGIGEDVRMAALALEAANIPFSIYNIEPGREVCQGDVSAVKHLSEDLPFSVNLFCMTGIETARLAAVIGRRLFDDRHCIGYWPWELPEWPEDWNHVYRLVDEVWASSDFTYRAFIQSSPIPVYRMPMAVSVEPTAGLARRDFDLPENRFLFVFSFDFLSSVARKNPQGCLDAFRLAFPQGDEPVGLVIKAMRPSQDRKRWEMLLKDVEKDSRITVIGDTLQRADLLDLIRACDCFVSLHRSEGFGRGMAEAMLLGKPVIATGYSGNTDFVRPGAAGVVKFDRCGVGKGEYPFAEGQAWADPDIDHAARWMRRLAEDRLLRDKMARCGRKLVMEKYLPQVVGQTYRRHLVGVGDNNEVAVI